MIGHVTSHLMSDSNTHICYNFRCAISTVLRFFYRESQEFSVRSQVTVTGKLQQLAKHPIWPMCGVKPRPVSNTNPPEKKRLHQGVILTPCPDRLSSSFIHSCPLSGAKKYIQLALFFTIVVHEKGSLTCSFRVVWAHSMQQISFITKYKSF